jgi:hypothetical protein
MAAAENIPYHSMADIAKMPKVVNVMQFFLRGFVHNGAFRQSWLDKKPGVVSELEAKDKVLQGLKKQATQMWKVLAKEDKTALMVAYKQLRSHENEHVEIPANLVAIVNTANTPQ